MNNERTSAGYWATAIIVVLAIVAAVWWYTAAYANPSVPNTGDTTQQTSTSMQDASGTVNY